MTVKLNASSIKETSRTIFLAAYYKFYPHIFLSKKTLSNDDVNRIFERIHNIAIENYDTEIWDSVEADDEKIWNPADPGKTGNFPLVPTLVTYVRAILIDRFTELVNNNSHVSDESATEKFTFAFIYTYINAMKHSVTSQLRPELLKDTVDSIVEHLIHFGKTAHDFNCLCVNLIIENIGLYNRLYQANMLKGLYNRHALFRIWEGKRDDTVVGVIMLDGDKFKEVNDTINHDAGDEVLEIYKDNILKAIDSMSETANRTFPARWGGEEFVICIYNSNQDEIIKLSTQIKYELSLPVNWNAFTERYKDKANKISFPRTISQGITLGTRSESKNFEELVKKADEQLYLAKNEGNRNCIYYKGGKVG